MQVVSEEALFVHTKVGVNLGGSQLAVGDGSKLRVLIEVQGL